MYIKPDLSSFLAASGTRLWCESKGYRDFGERRLWEEKSKDHGYWWLSGVKIVLIFQWKTCGIRIFNYHFVLNLIACFLFSPDYWTVLTEKDFIFLEAVLKGRYLPGLSYFTSQQVVKIHWVWGTNWMQCNFLSFESNSGLNGHNIIRLKPDVKAWNNHSIWCWNGYSLILSDSIWTLTNLLLYFTLTVLSLNQTSKVFRLFVKQLFAL